MEEIPLSGGRVTAGVVRSVKIPRWSTGRSPSRRSAGCRPPRFRGIDEKGREILSFLPGEAPRDLGRFSEEQLAAAAKIIRALHDGFAGFPGCGPGQVLCHNDLSPCNFLFAGGTPRFVIDWDACAIGDPLDDLA